MRIVIVEDNERFAGEVIHTLREFFTREEEAVQICQMEGTALLKELEKGPCCDLCLLDVEMPQMDGITLGKKIRERSETVRIVYLSAHDRYAVSGYSVRADHYVLKENYREELPRILMHILREEQERQTDYYTIQTDSQGVRIRISDILYLEKDAKYVSFHCRKKQNYRERGILGNIMEKLPVDRFVFVDKGVVVNLEHVVKYEGKVLTMRDETEVPVSRRTWPVVRAKLADYWG